jgi:hypothetical protein
VANDYLRIVCRRCHGLARLFSYYPSATLFAAYDVRAFIEAHVEFCVAEAEPGALSLGDTPPFEIHTDGSYNAAYGAIPRPEARLPDGGWRIDPPGHIGAVKALRKLYQDRDRAGGPQ